MGMWTRFRQRRRERQLDRMRKNALEYMFMLDTQMKKDNVPRCRRRQFKRELLNCGRHVEGVANA